MSDLFVGVDLGGTSIKAAVADAAGDVLLTRSAPTDSHRGPEDVIQRIGSLVGELVNESGVDRGALAGLGMGVPGLVDVATGVTQFLPNLPTQWRDVPVAELLKDQLACPVRRCRDRAAADRHRAASHSRAGRHVSYGQRPSRTLAARRADGTARRRRTGDAGIWSAVTCHRFGFLRVPRRRSHKHEQVD